MSAESAWVPIGPPGTKLSWLILAEFAPIGRVMGSLDQAALGRILDAMSVPAAFVSVDGRVLVANHWVEIPPGEPLLNTDWLGDDPTYRVGIDGRARWRVRQVTDELWISTGDEPQSNDHVMRRFFAGATDIFVILDDEERILDSNDAFSHVLGWHRDACAGFDLWSLVATEDQPHRAAIAADLARGRPVDITISMMTVDGGTRRVRWRFDADADIRRSFGIGTDVSELDELEAAKRDSLRFFENARELMLVLDDGSRILRANPAVERVLGHEPESLVGTEAFELIHHDDRRAASVDPLETGGVRSLARWRSISGNWRWIEATAVSDPMSGVVHVIGRDVTLEQQLTDELSLRASTDQLTGLANRSVLEAELHRLLRSERSVAVLAMDLDRFKVVNDSLGHATGDLLLRAFATRLAEIVRGDDTVVARLGGDEFVIVLPGVEHVDDAARVAERIIDSLEAPILIEGRRLHVSSSIGVALARPGEREAADLLRAADTAAYRAKELGRGCYVVHDDDLRERSERRLEVEQGLRRALEEDQFALHYQPIVALENGHIRGVEALVRWRQPDGKLLPPGAFLDVAEDAGLLVPLGAWVLEQACTEAARFAARGHVISVSVNLSAKQLAQPDLVPVVASILARSGVDPSLIVLEITEDSLIRDHREAAIVLQALRELGVNLAIDDFGTGYSSLGYLRKFPIDAVKIDKSFVDDLQANQATRAIVSAVVGLGRALDLVVVVEGIEEAVQAEEALSLGCELGQGYLYHWPAPADVIHRLLDEQAAHQSRI